jgi:hypothetical protein
MKRKLDDTLHLRALLHASEGLCRKATAEDCRGLLHSIHAHLRALLADAKQKHVA